MEGSKFYYLNTLRFLALIFIENKLVSFLINMTCFEIYIYISSGWFSFYTSYSKRDSY